MLSEKKEKWRNGVYLCTAHSSLEADILVSKLDGEGIPSMKNYKSASNFIEIAMGSNTTYPIDIYVPEDRLEDAKNIIIPIDLDDCEKVDFE